MIHNKVTYPKKKNEVSWLNDVPVVGVTFQAEGMQAISQPRVRDLQFYLQAEPTNIHDANAIAVLAVFAIDRNLGPIKVQIGYIERNLAQWITEHDVLSQLRVAGHKLFEDEKDMILGIRLVLNRREDKNDG